MLGRELSERRRHRCAFSQSNRIQHGASLCVSTAASRPLSVKTANHMALSRHVLVTANQNARFIYFWRRFSIEPASLTKRQRAIFEAENFLFPTRLRWPPSGQRNASAASLNMSHFSVDTGENSAALHVLN